MKRRLSMFLAALLMVSSLIMTVGVTNTFASKLLSTPSISKVESSYTGVKVTWKKVSGAAKYRVFRKYGSGSWQKIGNTTATSFTDTGAKSGYKYVYTVRCLSGDGKAYTSAYNKAGTAITYIASPKISKLESKSSGMQLTWSKIAGANKYRVFVKSSTSWKTIGNTTGTTFTHTGVNIGSRYTYTVRVLSKDGKKYVSSYNSTGWACTYDPEIIKSMTALTSLAEKPRTTNKLTDNYGNTYKSAVINNHGYSGSSGPIKYQYNLNGRYTRFAGTIYVPQGETAKGRSRLTVKTDGRVIYTSKNMDKTSSPIKFNLNITKCKIITIEWSNNSGYNNVSDLECCLSAPYFYSGGKYGSVNGTNPNTNAPIQLTDLTSINSKPEVTEQLTDNYDNEYPIAVYNRVDNKLGNKPPILEYLLNKKYRSFKGTLYVPEGMAFTSSVVMTVTADGNALYTSPAMTYISAPVNFNLDISNCNDLKITFSEYSWFNGNKNKTLCIGNPRFYTK